MVVVRGWSKERYTTRLWKCFLHWPLPRHYEKLLPQDLSSEEDALCKSIIIIITFLVIIIRNNIWEQDCSGMLSHFYPNSLVYNWLFIFQPENVHREKRSGKAGRSRALSTTSATQQAYTVTSISNQEGKYFEKEQFAISF